MITVEPQKILPQSLFESLTKYQLCSLPAILYTSGDLSLLKQGKRAAVVGSRNATDFSLNQTREISKVLVKNNFIVVSGLARGIDSEAHLGAIENDGKTIAVLGTPLDQIYPPENYELQQEIAINHLLISQFPTNTGVNHFNFLNRNRTIVMISDLIIIVTAEDNSGTINTANEAQKLGRQVVFPKYLSDRFDLKWPKKLLSHKKNPAKMFETAGEILNFFKK